ncbi:MAG: GGDEF domain-containing protein [Treponema sp.]|nr:GGDEF domain-containing protein [Treponema sp.]
MEKRYFLKKIKFLDHFEFQIIIVIFSTVLVTALSVFFFMSYYSRMNLLTSIQTRVENIFSYTDSLLSRDIFHLTENETDMETSIFIETQYDLYRIRQISDLKSLFTVKKEGDRYIYVVDGEELNNPEFKPLGKAVEKELLSGIEKAYKGIPVYTELAAQVNDRYISFWPVTTDYNAGGKVNPDKIIGLIGLRFNAKPLIPINIYTLLSGLFLIIVITLITGVFFSVIFQGISRPFHQKIAYIDVLTGLNNRTAFELDRKRIEVDLKNNVPISMIMFDLNNLKEVNDTLGHVKGDMYLTKAAQLIHNNFASTGTCYRIGGDEFCVISVGYDPKKLENILNHSFKKDMEQNRSFIKIDQKEYFAIAAGIAVYDENEHRDLYEVFIQADENMYTKKRQMKKEQSMNKG